jgi:hypothetical protein
MTNTDHELDIELGEEIERLYKKVAKATTPELPPYRYGALSAIRQRLDELRGSVLLLTGERDRFLAENAGRSRTTSE